MANSIVPEPEGVTAWISGMGSTLSEYEVHDPASSRMGTRATAMRQDFLVLAASFFQGIR